MSVVAPRIQGRDHLEVGSPIGHEQPRLRRINSAHREEDLFPYFPVPRPNLILATMWAMSDFTVDNGGTRPFVLVPERQFTRWKHCRYRYATLLRQRGRDEGHTVADKKDGDIPQQMYRGQPIGGSRSSLPKESADEAAAREALADLKRRFQDGSITRFEAEAGRKKILDELERKQKHR